MKKLTALLLLTLLLTGCGEKTASTESIQQQYEQIAAAHMEAEVTLHLAEENETFVLACDYAPGRSTVTIQQPEDLRGISATVEGDDLTVSYEGMILPAGTLDRVCPANVLAFLPKMLSDGYLTEYGAEQMEGVDCCRMTLDKDGVYCTVWLDTASLIPRFAEILDEDGAAALSVKMLTFSCTLTED